LLKPAGRRICSPYLRHGRLKLTVAIGGSNNILLKSEEKAALPKGHTSPKAGNIVADLREVRYCLFSFICSVLRN
jgi:hypothetical protein